VYTYDDKSKTALGLGQARELALPHTPRLVLLPPPTDIAERFAHLCISPNESLILRITPTKPFLSMSEPTPPPVTAAKDEPGSATTVAASGLGMNINALSGIGGYMGLGAKSKAIAGTVVGNEILVTRERKSFLHYCGVLMTSRWCTLHSRRRFVQSVWLGMACTAGRAE
jgi:hypothetical protein